MQDFYIPIGTTPEDVLLYSTAAHRDRPPSGSRVRTEMVMSYEAEDEEPEELVSYAADGGWDAERGALGVMVQAGPMITDLRAFVQDGLYYSRSDMTEEEPEEEPSEEVTPDAEPAAQAEPKPKKTPARWNQLIDSRSIGVPPEVIESYRHPENSMDQMFDLMAIPGVKLEDLADSSLPRGETGCVVGMNVNDFDAFLKAVPASQRDSMEGVRKHISFPVTMRLTISRETGYICLSETIFQIVDTGDPGVLLMKMRIMYYNFGLAVHVDAPPEAEVNMLLAPVPVTVIEATKRINRVEFSGATADGESGAYVLVDLREEDPDRPSIPMPQAGSRVTLRSVLTEEPSEAQIVLNYEAESPRASWSNPILDDSDSDDADASNDLDAGPVKIDERSVEITEVNEESLRSKTTITFRFPDGRQESVSAEVTPGSPALPVAGERLTLYRRQEPSGIVNVGLQREDDIIWRSEE